MDTDSENAGYYSMQKQYSGHISIDLQDSSSMRKNKDKLLMIESPVSYTHLLERWNSFGCARIQQGIL